MQPPTNPKKRALMPSGELRRKLRAAGHPLSPVVQVGKLGVTDAVRRQIGEALDQHELVKVRLGSESPLDRFEAADVFAAEPGVHVAQILGRVLLLYRRSTEHPRYEDAAWAGGAPV